MSSELGTKITNRDMYMHEPRYRDFSWMETNWFSWTVPEARLRGHVRAGFRTTLGVTQFTLRMWDNPDPHAGMAGTLYTDYRYNLPMPPQNLDNYQLLNGDYSVVMLEPRKHWSVRYSGIHDTCVDLDIRAMMPPLHVSESAVLDSPRHFVTHGHLDMMTHVTGTVRVRGREYEVDWPAPHDHSWGPRPEGALTRGYARSTSSNFDYGSFGSSGQDFTFFVLTTNEWESVDRGVVHSGYIIDHGKLLRLQNGEGRYTYDDRWVTRKLRYELVDELGRTHVITGEPCSFYWAQGPTVCAMVRWCDEAGQIGWGEYLWHGNTYEMQRIGRPPRSES